MCIRDSPLDGYVEIDGRRISGAPEKIKKQIRGKIGFMFQQGARFDSRSVGENVAFPLREEGIRNEEELDARISAALDSVDLLGQQEKMPASLSGGDVYKRQESGRGRLSGRRGQSPRAGAGRRTGRCRRRQAWSGSRPASP